MTTPNSDASTPNPNSTTPRPKAPAALLTVSALEVALTRVEEAEGLTPDMRRFLALRMLHESDRAALKAAGLGLMDATNWKHNSAAFRTEYDALLEAGTQGVVNYVRTELQRLSGLVPQTLADMLVAEETIPNGKGGDTITRPAWLARGKAIELLYRPLGLWAPEARPDGGNAVALEAMKLMHDLVSRRVERELPSVTVIDAGPAHPKLMDGAVPDDQDEQPGPERG